MKKPTRKQFFTIGIVLSMLILMVWSFTFSMTFPGDQPQPQGNQGAVHIVFNIFAICAFLVGMIVSIINLVNDDLDFFENCYREDKYSNSKKYNNAYIQKVQEKKGYYDKFWKSYLQTEKIADFVTKDVFIVVTKIIMENRKDGQNVAWKWLTENQQIPYNEFTKFYSNLSDLVTKNREGYFNIEVECQKIANQNNTMLDTFPNNIYNKVLNLNRINFEYGFTSDQTEDVFKTKKENIK